MVLGIGTDVAEVARIRQSAERFGQRFLDRVFTPNEQAYSLSKANWAERLAARFAAKEAGMKALGCGWSGGITWHDFEISNQASGRPGLTLEGAARHLADDLGVISLHLSLTHTTDLAFAVVIFEGRSRLSEDAR